MFMGGKQKVKTAAQSTGRAKEAFWRTHLSHPGRMACWSGNAALSHARWCFPQRAWTARRRARKNRRRACESVAKRKSMSGGSGRDQGRGDKSEFEISDQISNEARRRPGRMV